MYAISSGIFRESGKVSSIHFWDKERKALKNGSKFFKYIMGSGIQDGFIILWLNLNFLWLGIKLVDISFESVIVL